MRGLGIRWAKHHERRPPPTIQSILCHRPLGTCSAGQDGHDFKALTLMEAFLLTDADHGPRIRTVGTATEGYLIHDRRAIDQPADRSHIGPGQSRIVEDARVLR